MSGANNGGPAFPRDHAADGHNGMTLRDYFAAKALQGWLASYPTDMGAYRATLGVHIVASFAYSMADAMLEAREVQS